MSFRYPPRSSCSTESVCLLICLSALLSSTQVPISFFLSFFLSLNSGFRKKKSHRASAGHPQVFQTSCLRHAAVTDRIGSICLPDALF